MYAAYAAKVQNMYLFQNILMSNTPNYYEDFIKTNEWGIFMQLGAMSIWESILIKVMKHALYQKFTKNQEMKKFLLDTGDKILVNASINDQINAIGLPHGDLRAYKPWKWW